MATKDPLMERLQAQVGRYIDEYGHCVEVMPPGRMSCAPIAQSPQETPTPPETWNPAEVYKTNDPVGWCGDPGRGAAMGRNDVREIPEDSDLEFIIHVERILLIEGYDPNGTYFGQGMPLFWIYAQAEVTRSISCSTLTTNHTETVTLDYVERFNDIEDAVRIVKQSWPRAKVTASEVWCDELVEKYMDEEYERERDEELEDCAAATLHSDEIEVDAPGTTQVHKIMRTRQFFTQGLTGPIPPILQAYWDGLIERVRLAESVCELLAAHQPTYDESGYFDTTCLPELFRLAASAIDPE